MKNCCRFNKKNIVVSSHNNLSCFNHGNYFFKIQVIICKLEKNQRNSEILENTIALKFYYNIQHINNAHKHTHRDTRINTHTSDTFTLTVPTGNTFISNHNFRKMFTVCYNLTRENNDVIKLFRHK